MRKLYVCVALLAAGAVCGLSGRDALAQGKKDKDAGTIEISKGKDGKFRFSVRSADDKFLGGSGPKGLDSEKAARAAVDELKTVLAKAKLTKEKDAKKDRGAGTIEISAGKDGKFRFSIRDAEGKFLAGSGPQGFESEKAAKADLDDFKAVLAKGKVVLAK